MKKNNYQNRINFIIIFSLFLLNFFVQAYGIGKQVIVGTDEGVYLYAAKLVTQGHIPYKDFALPSHVPFLIYCNAFLLWITHFNMTAYHFIYIVWVFVTVFPLFYTVLYLTRSRLASIASIFLFSTYAELVQTDSHAFAFRQASLIFFACFFYFAYAKKKYILSQLSLALFSWCLITNFLISLIFVVTSLLYDFFISKYSISILLKKLREQYLIFFILSGIYYLIILFIPHSIQVIISAQTYRVPENIRFAAFLQELPYNWPIYIFGFLGIYISYKKHIQIFFLTIITILATLFIGNSFAIHYLSITSVPLSITGGYFIHSLLSRFDTVGKITFICSVCFVMYLTVLRVLFLYLIQYKTPYFFQTVKALQKAPEPLFTFQPIYALYAHKNLVFFYNIADMRIFTITRSNLPYAQYEAILKKSKTILLENSSYDRLLPEDIKHQIRQYYTLTYQNRESKIYERL